MPERNSVRILVIDDDEIFLSAVEAVLKTRNYNVLKAHDGDEGLNLLRKNIDINAVLLDLNLPEKSGEKVLVEIKQIKKDTPVIIVSADGDVNTVLRMAEMGADDFIVKRVGVDEFISTVEKMTILSKSYKKIGWTKVSFDPSKGDTIQGGSLIMNSLIKKIHRVAQLDSSVFIFGETGVGKELIAKTIHEQSKRKEKPFIIVDCSGLPNYDLAYSKLWGHKKGAFTGATVDRKGSVRQADGGTIFLDEVGTLEDRMQIQLLRFCNTKEFIPLGSENTYQADVRIISATNIDLQNAIDKGTFRSDLYHRLSQNLIEVPSLRERREPNESLKQLPTSHNHPVSDDIEILVDYSIDKYNKLNGEMPSVKGIEVGALRLLREYNWPGNIRQLNNVINEASSRASSRVNRVITEDDIKNSPLFGMISASKSEYKINLADLHKKVRNNQMDRGQFADKVREIVDKAEGNISKASELGGVTRVTMYKYINEYMEKDKKDKINT